MNTVEAARFVPGGLAPPGTIDLSIGYPDPRTFPEDLVDGSWLRRSAERIRGLSYGPPAGSPELTQVLRQTLLPGDRSVGLTLITNGSIEALDLAVRALAARDSVLLSEDPTFPGLGTLAANAGLRVVGVPTDDYGLDVDALTSTVDAVRNAGIRIAGVYTMPSASNPTGARLTIERRHALAAAAYTKDLLIIEDDAYRAIRIDGPLLPTLRSLAPTKVLHIQSLSKVFFPGLRLAFAIGPADFISAMLRLKPVGGTTPFGSEFIVANLTTFDYGRHLQLLRQVYRERRSAAVAAVMQHFPTASFAVPQGGFFLWLRLPEGLDGEALHARALSAGVSYLPGSLFTIDTPGTRVLRIAFSYEPIDRVADGVAILGEAANGL